MNRIHSSRSLILSALLCLGLANSQAAAPFFTFQGRLASSNNPVNGTVMLDLKIYDAPTGGVALSQVTIPNQPVDHGLFTAVFDAPGLATVFNSDAPRFLDVTINGEELVPRQQIASTPFAIFAQDAGRLNGQGSSSFAPSVHTHSAADITSGVLAVARGGLGTDTSAAATGSLLRLSATGAWEPLGPPTTPGLGLLGLLPELTSDPIVPGWGTVIRSINSDPEIIVEPDTSTVDQAGRVRVRFNWDKVGGLDRSNVWSRVQAFSGGFSGSMILPRVGWETVVEFLEGDPDRPIVTGRVFNHEDLPPYHGPSWKLKGGDAVGTDRDGGDIIFDPGQGTGAGNNGKVVITRDLVASGGITAASFSGAGTGLTGLSASSLASGAIPDARLSGNVALLNQPQTFSVAPTFAASGTPFLVTSSVRVANLHADRAGMADDAMQLGGLSASSYARLDNTSPQTFTGPSTFGSGASVNFNQPPGTPPFQVTSTTTVPNLNAQFVGGLYVDQLARRDTNNTFAGTNIFKTLLLDGLVSRLSLSSSSGGFPPESLSFKFQAVETDYGTNRKGASVEWQAGHGTGSSANGGDLALQAGAGTGTGTRGSVSLSGQSVQTFLGSTGEAFEMTFLDGSASVSLRLPILSTAPPRNGLSLSLDAQAGTGTDSDGGNLWLRTGSATGSGTPGKVSVRGDPAQTGVSIDFSPGPYTPGRASVLKIADNSIPNPQDRVFFSFDYFDGLSWRGTAQGSIGGNAATASSATTLASGTQGGQYNFSNPLNVFQGDGSGLTQVNAASFGGLASASFAQLAGNNQFTGANVIAPSDDSSALILRACCSGSSSSNSEILTVKNKEGTIPYLTVKLDGNVVIGSNVSVNGSVNGNTINGMHTGNGSGLTSLNASALSSGAVPSAALPPTVAYTDRTQTFSMAQNLSGGLISTGVTRFGDHIQMALGNIDNDATTDVWSISTDSRPNRIGTSIQLQAADGDGVDKDGGDISLAPGNSTGAGVVGKVKVTRDLAVAGAVTAGGALLANGGAFTGHVVVNGSDLNVFGGNLSVAGNICATGTIGACSDARFKEQVQPLAGALATISKLRGVYFAWKRNEFPDRHFSEQRQVGFLAQEIKETMPEVVTQNKDGFYSVDYGRLTPVLVEAIKEQQRNMDQALREKETEINALKERLAGLEKLVMTITEKLAADKP